MTNVKFSMAIWETGAREHEVEVNVFATLSPAEAQTRTYPGCLARVEVWSVLTEDGHELLEGLDQTTLESLEEEAFAQAE